MGGGEQTETISPKWLFPCPLPAQPQGSRWEGLGHIADIRKNPVCALLPSYPQREKGKWPCVFQACVDGNGGLGVTRPFPP